MGYRISIHAPRVGCDCWAIERLHVQNISIHAPRVGCDRASSFASSRNSYFNPRTPRGVRRYPRRIIAHTRRFQSTHPAWGATPDLNALVTIFKISIHAPRVGCDQCNAADDGNGRHFNPRTPRGVRLQPVTLPHRQRNFNPRTPRGVRQEFRHQIVENVVFQSTHPAWGATIRQSAFIDFIKFQSTHPAWGATLNQTQRLDSFRHFNPRTPRGVRPKAGTTAPPFHPFQSTHPAWGATYGQGKPDEGRDISIHAPRVGCDSSHRIQAERKRHFNPRTPRGVRPIAPCFSIASRNFNPRTPRGVRLRFFQTHI